MAYLCQCPQSGVQVAGFVFVGGCDIIRIIKVKKMNKKDLFVNATQQVEKAQDEVKSAADMKNWLLVHATGYLPRKNKDGAWAIPTTAMATGFDIPRSTVHFTLNHIVQGHAYGNWDGQPYVVVMPYLDVVEKNGNPQELALFDTWFSPNPDTGMVLPEGTRVVRPATDLPAGQLIEVRGNEVVYKSIDFTPEEEKLILSKLDSVDKMAYERYANADFSDVEIEVMVAGLGEKGKKMYEAAKDKRAFLRGIFENDKGAILGRFVRDMAFNVCVSEMGGQTWQEVADMSRVAQKVADVGLAKKLNAIAFNKGHSSSLEHEIEMAWQNLDSFFVRGYSDYNKDKGVFDYSDKGLFTKTDDLNAVFDYIKENLQWMGAELAIEALVSGKPLNLMSVIKPMVSEYNGVLPNGFEKLSDVKPNLDITVQRWVKKLSDRFEQWHAQIEKMPGYDEFLVRVRGLANELSVRRVMERSGYEI